MKNPNEELALTSEKDLSLVKDNVLNLDQLKIITSKTPDIHVRKRPAKGGGQWDYVSGGYIKRCLNYMFGWDWDFEIVAETIYTEEVVVKGRLTCRSGGRTIVKMQYGNKDIIYKRELSKNGDRVPLSIGNDMKSAATDALKKCAAEIGIAADIYNKQDFEQLNVVGEADLLSIEEQIENLFEFKKEGLTPTQVENIERIIKNKETKSYKKVLNFLKTQ